MDEYLVYIKFVCKNNDESYDYDFYFSEQPDIVWGPDWDIFNPSSCDELTPEVSTCSSIKRVNCVLPLKTIEETSCYSMEYATYGIVALAWIDIENLEEYPENGRMVFHFGDTKEKTVELLSLYGYNLEN